MFSLSNGFIRFVIVALIIRFLFLLHIGYVDDDAYHWTWTKNLSLSYFDHPGMIAWLEYLSTRIFGDTKLGIRIPGFVCFCLMLVLIWNLMIDVFDRYAANLS